MACVRTGQKGVNKKEAEEVREVGLGMVRVIAMTMVKVLSGYVKKSEKQ